MILFISTDNKLAYTLNCNMNEAPYEVNFVVDSNVGFELAIEKQYDLIILDLAHHDKDGLRILKKLRGQENMTPILMLTSDHSDSVDEVLVSLYSGADACVTRPFDNCVLVARIKAMIRRRKWDRGSEIRYANICIDPVTHMVWREDTEIALSKREYDLLVYLMQNTEQLLTRKMIAKNVWDCDDIFSNIVNVYIGHLRKKLDNRFETKLIHTFRNEGYLLKTV